MDVKVKGSPADVRWVWPGDPGRGLTELGIRLWTSFRPVSGVFILGIKLKEQQLPWESSSTSRLLGHKAKLKHTADLRLLLRSHLSHVMSKKATRPSPTSLGKGRVH